MLASELYSVKLKTVQGSFSSPGHIFGSFFHEDLYSLELISSEKIYPEETRCPEQRWAKLL
jgi:hypothetical protein